MKKIIYLLLVIGIGMFTNTAKAQELRKGGSSFGKIESNGGREEERRRPQETCPRTASGSEEVTTHD